MTRSLKIPVFHCAGSKGKGDLHKTKGVKIMAEKNKPTHTAYVVTGKGDKANWHEVGAVWLHKDGSGFDLTIFSN